MTLEESTGALLAAIEVEDLEAVARAVAERTTALKMVIEEGQRACRALTALKQKLALGGARLSQFETGFAQSISTAEPSHDTKM